jgi:hypothetical protein
LRADDSRVVGGMRGHACVRRSVELAVSPYTFGYDVRGQLRSNPCLAAKKTLDSFPPRVLKVLAFLVKSTRQMPHNGLCSIAGLIAAGIDLELPCRLLQVIFRRQKLPCYKGIWQPMFMA